MKIVIITGSARRHGTTALAGNEMFRQMTGGYLEWENAGILNARGASVAADLSEDDLARAYALGRELR